MTTKLTKSEKDTLKTEYEETMSKIMSCAISGVFILPIIFGTVAKVRLEKLEDKFYIRPADKWKRTLVNWSFAIGMIQLLIVAILLGVYVISGGQF